MRALCQLRKAAVICACLAIEPFSRAPVFRSRQTVHEHPYDAFLVIHNVDFTNDEAACGTDQGAIFALGIRQRGRVLRHATPRRAQELSS